VVYEKRRGQKTFIFEDNTCQMRCIDVPRIT